VGYADCHAGDVYKMFNPVTSKVTLTRDVCFLGKYYEESKNSTLDDEEPKIDEIGIEDDLQKRVMFEAEIVNEKSLHENERNDEMSQVEAGPRIRSRGLSTNDILDSGSEK